MRKFIAFSFCILLFSMISGTVFAGKVEVCESIKHDKAYKGLYGLCNAYWNANDKAKEKILRNFEKKAGPDGPGMPGLEEPEPEVAVVCPCWANGELDNAFDPFAYQISETFAIALFDYQNVYFLSDMGYCEHIDNNTGAMNIAFPTPEQDEKCLADVTQLIADHFPEAIPE